VFESYNYDAIPSLDPQQERETQGEEADRTSGQDQDQEEGTNETQATGKNNNEESSYHTITQEDCWQVISAFFSERNLVSQQISSFDGFVNTTMQELVDETGPLVLEQSMQYTDKAGDMTVRGFFFSLFSLYI
jgi:hypothetical protein